MSDYTYASARVKALESALLSSSHLELLVSAKGVDELYTVLYDTYLASYLRRNTEQDIQRAIDDHLTDTKHLLVSIAPDPGILDILWIKYDYHNLKVVVKGVRTGQSDEEILAGCYTQSNITPERLLALVRSETLALHEPVLAQTYMRACAATEPGAVDELCNAAYFERMRQIATESKDPFALDYVRALIDLFNLKALARGELRETFRTRHALIEGGACPVLDTLDAREVAQVYTCYGNASEWKEVVQHVAEGGSVAQLEKTADEAFATWLALHTVADFGLANLLSYFHAVKNNAQVVSAIAKAKRAGMSEKALRSILRTRHR